jgi:hypothetical protein
MKVLFNKFHRRINLAALLLSSLGIKLRIQILEISSPKGTFHTNSDSEWKMTVLFNKFHHRINLVALFFGQGTKPRSQNLEIWKS